MTGALAVTNAWSSTGEWNAVGANGNNPIELTAGGAINDNWLTVVANPTMTIDGPITDGAGRTGCFVVKNWGGMVTLKSTASTYSGGLQMPSGNGTLDLPVSSVNNPDGSVASGPAGTGTIAIGYSTHERPRRHWTVSATSPAPARWCS